MKILSILLVALAVAVLLSIGLPIAAAAVGLVIAFGGLLIWLLPFVIIATSDKTTGMEKLAWLLLMVFLSWFAWVFYFLLAPIKPRPDRYTGDAAYRLRYR